MKTKDERKALKSGAEKTNQKRTALSSEELEQAAGRNPRRLSSWMIFV